jgi:hypothetical protein
MYVSNAYKRGQRSKSNDSPVTAGAPGRVPRVGVNKSDLEAQAAEHGWTARPLTYSEVLEMPSSEFHWHEQFNKESLEKALAMPAIGKHNDDVMKKWANKRMWDGGATEQESQKAFAAGDRFASSYSQFIRSESNGLAICAYLAQRNLDATDVRNYVIAYEALVAEGKLVLSPKAAGIGMEETLTGDELRNYARLNLLLQPNKALRPEDKLSADEWFSAHPELHDTRTPPLIQKRVAQNANTAEYWKQTEASTAKSGSTSVTDYPRDRHGASSPSEKYSFRKLVGSLSSTEIAQRCQQDPAFKKALDEQK